MGVLEQVTQMKDQGMPDEQIISELQQQGISPKAINDAMGQSQIKNAVSDESNIDEYQPSTMENPEIAPPEPIESSTYSPQTQEMPEEQAYAPYTQDYSQPQDTYQQPGYEDYSAGESYSDTIIEVSEQVFSEKIKKIQKQLDELNEFKTLAETKINYVEKSLKRIETIMDKLQIAILEKIGSYGKNLESIKKEMSMMQDSFGKMIKHKTHTTPPSHTLHKPFSKTKRKSRKK